MLKKKLQISQAECGIDKNKKNLEKEPPRFFKH